jgi:hypothetical protein
VVIYARLAGRPDRLDAMAPLIQADADAAAAAVAAASNDRRTIRFGRQVGSFEPWKQCWSRTANGGQQRPLEEQLTVTRPPSGTARVSGWCEITRAGGTVASTRAPPALDVPAV